MESDSSDSEGEISKLVKQATENLLPQKSGERYEKEYDAFTKWCSSKYVEEISEDVLIAYFEDKFKDKKSSSLWCYYSMLKSTLSVKNNISINKYARLIAYLKKKSVGYRAKKSNVLKREDIEKFIKEAPDIDFLLLKVIFFILNKCTVEIIIFDIYWISVTRLG